jgi:menaquinone-9 beta-reductase
VLVDAHGSWLALPAQREGQRQRRGAADLFAFKASFQRSALPAGVIGVLALDGGYGGMVVGDRGLTTLACCIRRDRLSALRRDSPGQAVGEVVEAFLRNACAGVRDALQGAEREGPWLTAGPLATGVRLAAGQGVFCVGNAAGEAHPLLGEGMSMALQASALLCRELLGGSSPSRSPAVPGAAEQAAMQRRYAAAWRRDFVPRMRLAATFAHLSMRPAATAALLQAVQRWPGLLTHGARWGGKVRAVETLPLSPAWRPGARAVASDTGPARPSNQEHA